MFKYWQGYEIDGSDTSYNLIIPEKEKCIELIKYYLQLKTIDRNYPFQVVPYNKVKDYSDEYIKENTRIFSYEKIDEFIDFLLNASYEYVSITYWYVAFDKLYPEIKRELINIVANLSNVADRNFISPTLLDNGPMMEDLNLTFNPKQAKRAYQRADSVSSEKYLSKIVENNFCTVELICSIGAPFASIAYNNKQIAERFPELEIEFEEYMKDAYALAGKEIYERIEIESNDFVQTIKRLVQGEDFNFHYYDNRERKYINNTDYLRCWYLPNMPECNLKELSWFHLDAEGNVINFFDAKSDRLDILKGITNGKNTFTVEEYIDYVNKLAQVDFFSSQEFSRLTIVYLKLNHNNAQKTCRIKFIKENNSLKLILEVPYQVREYICKKYNLA